MYEIIWNKEALCDLTMLPEKLATDIKVRITTYLIYNPRELGKSLQGKLKGKYRYRYGKHRIIYEVLDKNKEINILAVGSRAEIYN